MNYDETLHWMFGRLPMFQRQGAAAYKNNLDNILLLSEHLGNPHKHFKSIHIAGTNGKGSTSHMIASVLQEEGYSTGLYTSPHLKDFRERIRVNGVMAEELFVIQFIKKHKQFLEDNELSFFELTVGMAFQYFADKQVDIAVIEVGLGGRLDATNIITPILSVITNIGLDHTVFLGTTISQIAGEKAGIIKNRIPVVIGERQEETTTVFKSVALQNDAPIYFTDESDYPELASELKGNYQQRNKQTVQKAIEVLNNTTGFEISQRALEAGVKCVVTNTGFLGRWQVLQEVGPKIICDTGHNAEGLTYVTTQLKKEKFNQLHIVLGVVSDKELSTVLPLFPKNAHYYFSKPEGPRGLDESILKEKAAHFGLLGKKYENISEAFTAAKQTSKPDDLIFIGGSTFVVAEVI
ncbi:bifunctional folylpolyglutamate synthase/dihydrofolate synthase [Leeuwenhoekiella sp. NPDC079379]|uniref:bifunctional folylpolyglutamate synthase/dihydrofolate synthase n=1 Tax=Leeuwenhoekiella sp. NPDC079379 TaxID=3364122 RepID=UPI0037C82B87